MGALLTSSGVATAVTVPVALGAGTGMGAAALALVRVLMHTPTDATPSREDFIGAIAKVITPISADGVGEVLLTRHGQPWKVTAQLVEGEAPLPAGTSVIVVDTLSATRVVVTASTL
jgi:membrane protein implicated in regulation of membrane protease activity